MTSKLSLEACVSSANTGLDAIKRAPIVEHDTGIKCLRIQDVSQSKDFKNWGFTEVTPENFAKFQLKKGDILIARTGGSIGVNRYILEDLQAVYNNGLIRIRVDIEKYYPRFVYYLLRTDSFKQHINAIAFSTAAQPNMKIKDFLRFEFIDLDLDRQIYIADMLSKLDHKIELNRQANQTLEQIAQAIFKSWFVDFEPTRAKIAAKQNSQDPERAAMATISGKLLDELDQLSSELQQQLKTTAALFPDFMVDSEQGEIPEGWEVKSLDKKMTPKKGKNITKKTITLGEVPVVAGGLTPAYYHNVHNVVAPVITISASGANAGFINLYHQDIWASDCSFVNKEEFDFIYSAYLFLKSRQDEVTKMQQGAAQPHVYPKDLARLILVDPPENIWRILENIVQPFFENIKNNINEEMSLESLRDILLPKLLSGQLRLDEVA